MSMSAINQPKPASFTGEPRDYREVYRVYRFDPTQPGQRGAYLGDVFAWGEVAASCEAGRKFGDMPIRLVPASADPRG